MSRDIFNSYPVTSAVGPRENTEDYRTVESQIAHLPSGFGLHNVRVSQITQVNESIQIVRIGITDVGAGIAVSQTLPSYIRPLWH